MKQIIIVLALAILPACQSKPIQTRQPALSIQQERAKNLALQQAQARALRADPSYMRAQQERLRQACQVNPRRLFCQ